MLISNNKTGPFPAKITVTYSLSFNEWAQPSSVYLTSRLPQGDATRCCFIDNQQSSVYYVRANFFLATRSNKCLDFYGNSITTTTAHSLSGN